MSRNIRVVGIVLLAMFLALFGSSTYIQFVQEPELVADGRNTRTLLASYEVQRGPILVDGNPIAYSEADGSSYMYQRVYTDGEVYAPITGYYSANQGATQLEEAMNAELSGTADSQFFTSLRALFTGEEPAGAAIETTINQRPSRPPGMRLKVAQVPCLRTTPKPARSTRWRARRATTRTRSRCTMTRRLSRTTTRSSMTRRIR